VVYRSPQINWNLLTGPVGRGLDYKNQASLNFSQTLTGVGRNIGQGFADRRARAESRYRFDQQLGLQQERLGMERERLDMAQAEMLRKQEERRVNDEMLKRLFLGEYDKAQQEVSLTGQMSPQTAESFNRTVTAIGGPDAAMTSLLTEEQKAQKDCAGGT